VGEIAHALYDEPHRPPLLSYVGGLGGKEISEGEFERIIDELQFAAATGVAPPPRLLYTEAEASQMRRLLKIAGKEIDE
jgi:pyruvate ferredoxin oxidoreductase alpha subunit